MRIVLDPVQENIYQQILGTQLIYDNILHRIGTYFISGYRKYSGIYLYGSVGSGKTMLMKKYAQQFTKSLYIVHYQELMYNIHKNYNLYRKNNKQLEEFAFVTFKQYKLICIDEFEIKDITDAMLLMRLLLYFHKIGIIVFITSNRSPKQLVSDRSIQKSFMPCIQMIENNYKIFQLCTKHDYRVQINYNLQQDYILYPKNEYNQIKMKEIIGLLCPVPRPRTLNIFSRDIEFKNTNDNILVTNYSELFERDLSYSDYILITQEFDTIIIDYLPLIPADNGNFMRRFINFIDNAYNNKVLIYTVLQTNPDQLYTGSEIVEFGRTISRLHEMSSRLYFLKSKANI